MCVGRETFICARRRFQAMHEATGLGVQIKSKTLRVGGESETQ